MLVQEALKFASGGQGVMSYALSLNSKWSTILCIIILLTSMTNMHGPSLACTSDMPMSDYHDSSCHDLLTTVKYHNLEHDIFPGIPIIGNKFPDGARAMEQRQVNNLISY
jgi:hypothetical protein